MKVKRQYWQYKTISNKSLSAFDCAMHLSTSNGWELVEGSFQTMAAEHNLMYSVLIKRQREKMVEIEERSPPGLLEGL